MIQFVIAAERDDLHRAVADWLRVEAKTPYPLAWKTADRVLAEKTDDVVYLTAAQLLRYRDDTLAGTLEYVRIP